MYRRHLSSSRRTIAAPGGVVAGFLLLALCAAGGKPCSAAETDALAISQNIQALHFPHSTLIDPVYNSRYGMTVVSYTRCGDSALWTGAYLAAEAFRYKVTRSPDALANAQRAFAGMKALVDVTGNNVLARCLIPDGSPYGAAIQSEEAANGIYRSGPGNFWVGNTSRDEYAGVIFGLGVAYEMVDDSGLQTAIAGVVTRLVQFLKDHSWSVPMPDGSTSTTFVSRPDQILAFLQLARHVNPDQFSTAYDLSRLTLSPTVTAPIGVDVLSDSSYFKFNLDAMTLYTLIHGESSDFKSLYQQAYSLLWKHTDDHQNAFFNMIDRALNGPNPQRDAQTVSLLDQWLLRVRRDPYFDHSGKYPSCGDPQTACQPIPIVDRAATDFIWQRSPFQLAGGADGLIETAGIDYILPYWMARYYGVIQPDNLYAGSSASGARLLAPESLATVYGTFNVPEQSANVQPPPQSLGGVTVSVKDLGGNVRPAAIYYVSPAQINFVVPPSTFESTGSVTIHGAGATDTILSTEIRNTAPALFTADSSGKGPPAATAIRVLDSLQWPLPVFRCSAGGCQAEPIQLGVDTPVILTLYGTGLRNRSSLAAVTCTIGGISVPVQFAGPQPQSAGLDQVNVALPLNLRNLGETDLVLTVDGRESNAVRVHVR